VSTDDLVLKAAALKTISDFTKDRYDETRAELSGVMNRGDRLIARSPLTEEKLGAVYMTDPATTCRVSDIPALTEWMTEHYPELTENGYQVIGSEAEVVAVLFEHAPHLLRQVRKVTGEALSELKAACVSLGTVMGPGGEADVPGLELQEPEAFVACKPAETALQSVMDLYRAGRLDLDGTVRPALEEASNG